METDTDSPGEIVILGLVGKGGSHELRIKSLTARVDLVVASAPPLQQLSDATESVEIAAASAAAATAAEFAKAALLAATGIAGAAARLRLQAAESEKPLNTSASAAVARSLSRAQLAVSSCARVAFLELEDAAATVLAALRRPVSLEYLVDVDRAVVSDIPRCCTISTRRDLIRAHARRTAFSSFSH